MLGTYLTKSLEANDSRIPWGSLKYLIGEVRCVSWYIQLTLIVIRPNTRRFSIAKVKKQQREFPKPFHLILASSSSSIRRQIIKSAASFLSSISHKLFTQTSYRLDFCHLVDKNIFLKTTFLILTFDVNCNLKGVFSQFKRMFPAFSSIYPFVRQQLHAISIIYPHPFSLHNLYIS